MLNTSQHLAGIPHQFVKKIYLKKNAAKGHKCGDVLIIKAQADERDDLNEHEGLDPYMAALLMNLKDMERQVKIKAGVFNLNHIRRH